MVGHNAEREAFFCFRLLSVRPPVTARNCPSVRKLPQTSTISASSRPPVRPSAPPSVRFLSPLTPLIFLAGGLQTAYLFRLFCFSLLCFSLLACFACRSFLLASGWRCIVTNHTASQRTLTQLLKHQTSAEFNRSCNEKVEHETVRGVD